MKWIYKKLSVRIRVIVRWLLFISWLLTVILLTLILLSSCIVIIKCMLNILYKACLLSVSWYKNPRLPALSTVVGLIIWASLGESSVSSMTEYFLYSWNWSDSQRTVIRPPGKYMGRAFSSNRDLLVSRPSVSFITHDVILRYFVELVTYTKSSTIKTK